MPTRRTNPMWNLPLYSALVMLMACQPEGAVGSEATITEADAIAGENLGGTNLGGANLGGANLSGTNLGGANLGGTNLSGPNLGGANLGGTNLGGPNLAGNNLSGTNLSGSNLAGTNLSGTNLSGTNLSGSNLSGSNLSGPNLSGSNLSGTNLAGSNLSAADIGKSIHVINDTSTTITSSGGWVKGATASAAIQGNVAYASSAGSLTIPFTGNSATVVASKTTASGIMRVKLDGVQVALVDLYGASAARRDVYSTPPTMANGAHTMTLEWTGTKNAASTGTTVWFDALRFTRGNQMLRSGEDTFHLDNKNGPVDSSCVVMGIGSTAFSRLVTANTGANMYGVMAKLPWGFKPDAASPMTLEAWEVLVWGSNTYCTFIVPAPVGTTYEGVRGFIKAVFRWNAPPTKSISLGAMWMQFIDGVPTNGWQWEAGNLKRTGHLDGEGRPHGEWTFVADDGFRDGGEGTYHHGKPVGRWNWYAPGTTTYQEAALFYDNGQLAARGNQRAVKGDNGIERRYRLGEWEFFDAHGTPRGTVTYLPTQLIDVVTEQEQVGRELWTWTHSFT